jgi:hypothetical protein
VRIWVTTARLTVLARWSSITRAGLTRLAKTATRTGKQIGFASLPGLAQTAAQIDRQFRLAMLTGLAELATRSIKQEVPIMLLTWKAVLWKIRLTRKAGLLKIWLTQKMGLYMTRGARNRKKEKVLLQAKG